MEIIYIRIIAKVTTLLLTIRERFNSKNKAVNLKLIPLIALEYSFHY